MLPGRRSGQIDTVPGSSQVEPVPSQVAEVSRPTVQQNDSERSVYSTEQPVYDAPTGPPPGVKTEEPPAYAVEYVKAAEGTTTTVHDLQKGMEKTGL